MTSGLPISRLPGCKPTLCLHNLSSRNLDVVDVIRSHIATVFGMDMLVFAVPVHLVNPHASLLIVGEADGRVTDISRGGESALRRWETGGRSAFDCWLRFVLYERILVIRALHAVIDEGRDESSERQKPCEEDDSSSERFGDHVLLWIWNARAC